MNKNVTIGITILILALGAYQVFKPSGKVTEAEVQPKTNTATTKPSLNNKAETKKMTQPELTINKSKEYTATLNTSEGVIKVKLYADKTPITVNNFVYLANEKFYDNTVFHRVITGFMIQGGDPDGTGRGGPGYKFDDEPFEGKYDRGILAMANAGPNTNGSQFFIMHKDYPLPNSYVIFGEVLTGLETVDKIAEGEVAGDAPVNPVTVKSITIEEK